MKYLIIIATLAVSFSPVFAQKTKATIDSKCERYISERLSYYFSQQAVEAALVTNNVDKFEPLRSRTEKIKIGPHTIEWIGKGENRNVDFSVRINGELITLKDKQSLNLSDGNQKLNMYVIGRWDQIKLYKLSDRDLIAITMSPDMCTGLMCGVGAQLYYDVRSKRSALFGSYRTDREVNLYQFPPHEALFILSTGFDGDPHMGTNPAVVTYNLYRLMPDGQFRIEKNLSGISYFIRHTVFPENPAKPDALEVNWIENLAIR